ncbi:nucleotidyltransferase family protein [Rhodocyclaceae bacterium SMB388]
MKPSIALRQHRDAVLRIASDLGASNVRVFGSVIRGEDNENSDIDLLVDVPRGTTLLDMVRLHDAIEGEIGVPVDVLTVGDLHPKFRDEVLEEALPL